MQCPSFSNDPCLLLILLLFPLQQSSVEQCLFFGFCGLIVHADLYFSIAFNLICKGVSVQHLLSFLVFLLLTLVRLPKCNITSCSVNTQFCIVSLDMQRACSETCCENRCYTMLSIRCKNMPYSLVLCIGVKKMSKWFENLDLLNSVKEFRKSSVVFCCTESF